MKPVIDIETQEHVPRTRQARHDWAIVTGKPVTLKPAVFLHTETQERYCHIVGGIAFPTAVNVEIRPGVVIIVGVQNEPKVLFRVLESFESQDVFSLIEKAVELRQKYGFGLDRRILPNWYGDQDKYQTIIVKTSEQLEKRLGFDKGFYIKDMVDLRQPNSFPLYVRQLTQARRSGRFEKPTISGDITLTPYLKKFQAQDAEKGKTDQYPVVGLLGGMIHSLQIEQPWLEDIDDQGTVFNIDL